MTTNNMTPAQLLSTALDDNQALPTTLEHMVANTCFCKLRTFCPDKTSSDCLKHRNLYQEFFQDRK